jgi:hypothetical protein
MLNSPVEELMIRPLPGLLLARTHFHGSVDLQLLTAAGRSVDNLFDCPEIVQSRPKRSYQPIERLGP